LAKSFRFYLCPDGPVATDYHTFVHVWKNNETHTKNASKIKSEIDCRKVVKVIITMIKNFLHFCQTIVEKITLVSLQKKRKKRFPNFDKVSIISVCISLSIGVVLKSKYIVTKRYSNWQLSEIRLMIRSVHFNKSQVLWDLTQIWIFFSMIFFTLTHLNIQYFTSFLGDKFFAILDARKRSNIFVAATLLSLITALKCDFDHATYLQLDVKSTLVSASLVLHLIFLVQEAQLLMFNWNKSIHLV